MQKKSYIGRMLSDVWLKRILGVIFLGVLGYTFWLGQLGWHHTIMEEHSFRQTQTAIGIESVLNGPNTIHYELPLLGPPWELPLEFPTYQWLAAKTHSLTGIPIEQSGRLVSRASFYASLFGIFLLLQALGVSVTGRLVAMIFFLLSPIYLYWSRTVMIEVTAMFFSLTYAGLAAKGMQKRSLAWLVVGMSFGVLGALTKSTTFAAFGVLTFAVFCFFAKQRHGRNFRDWIDRQAIVELALTCGVPLLVGIIWAKHSDSVRALNPLARDFLTGEYFFYWNFGEFKLKFDSNFWNMLFRRALHDSIGHRTTFIVSLLLIAWQRKYWRFYLLFVGLFLFPPLLFTNLYFVHNYYLCANAIFLVMAMAIVATTYLEKRDFRRYIGIIFFLFCAGYAVRDYHKVAYHLQKADRPDMSASGEALNEFLPKGDVVLIYGNDWYPVYAYYSKRKVIMNRWPLPITDPKMEESLQILKERGQRIGAILFCNESSKDTDLILSVTSHLGFDGEPTDKLALTMCPTHLPLEKAE